jgi:hypothetical protein
LDPSRDQLAITSGLSVGTISRAMKDIKKMIEEAGKALPKTNNIELDANTKNKGGTD